ncbi:SDR family NAD(P)-dependent oxidoreductase [Algoriphagus litoralis]|uniref:SDR family NAD(P)-dependent oxidoreductase n=1 Tax=Algoriphagus litoralis TaxID=2202829 RepID=UPI000DBA3B0B|nr:SDR family NAD(P)-dependent oxidoreductase [Algoriphagus litoralis]
MKTQKIWFITGASKGMGLELTKAVLENGDKVIATSRSTELLLQNVGQHSVNLLALPLDITSDEDVARAISDSIKKFGRIDVVVNNAGYNLLGNVEELSDAEFRETMDVNFFGMVNVIRHVLPHLRRQKSGHILNISSVMGYLSYPGNGSYSASKFAVIGLSEALAQEVSAFGIKVTILAPGTFRTSFMSESSLSVAKNQIDVYKLKDQIELFKSIDGKQLGDPKKLATLLIDLVNLAHAPLHLPLGSDSFAAILHLRAQEKLELENWKSFSLATDISEAS